MKNKVVLVLVLALLIGAGLYFGTNGNLFKGMMKLENSNPETVQVELTKAQEEVDNLTVTLESAKADLAKKQSELSLMTSKLKDGSVKSDKVSRTGVKPDTKLADLQNQINLATQKVNDLEAKLKEALGRVDELTALLEQLNSQPVVPETSEVAEEVVESEPVVVPDVSEDTEVTELPDGLQNIMASPAAFNPQWGETVDVSFVWKTDKEDRDYRLTVMTEDGQLPIKTVEFHKSGDPPSGYKYEWEWNGSSDYSGLAPNGRYLVLIDVDYQETHISSDNTSGWVWVTVGDSVGSSEASNGVVGEDPEYASVPESLITYDGGENIGSFNPNIQVVPINFKINGPAYYSVTIKRNNWPVKTLAINQRTLAAQNISFTWDGKLADGGFAGYTAYKIEVKARPANSGEEETVTKTFSLVRN